MPADAFRRQPTPTGALTQPGATGPLRAPAATTELATKALTDVVAQLRTNLAKREPAAELLVEACRRLPLAIPGVGHVELRHARSAKGDEIVLYLVTKMKAADGLPRRIQVGAFRFYDAAAGADAGDAALQAEQVQPSLIEQLRRKLFHLVNLHADFADEPVLAQLFPGPRTLAAAKPPMSNAERLRAKSKFQGALMKAEGLYQRLAPQMAAVAALARALTTPASFDVKEMLAPETRMVRLMAFRVGGDAAVRELVTQAVRDFEALRAAIDKAREAEDAAGLEEAAFPLSAFVQACREHPALRDMVSG